LVVLWVAITASLLAVREVLLPFLLAVFLAYVIEPPVSWLAQRHIKGRSVGRLGAVVGIYLAVFALLTLMGIYLVPQVSGEAARLASWTAEEANHADERLDALAEWANGVAARVDAPVHVINSGASVDAPPPVVDVVAGAPVEGERVAVEAPQDGFEIDVAIIARDTLQRSRGLLDPGTGVKIAGRIQAWVGGVLGGVFRFFLVLMLTAFLLADTDRIKRFFFSIVPMEDRAHYDDLLARVDHGLSGVVRGQLTICLINGVLTLIGLLLFQVKYAFVLAGVAAVFSLIPIFGSILSTIPIVVVAFVNAGPMTAVGVLVWIIGIHLLEANLLNPKVMGDAAKIHPAVVVLALVAGEHFYGIAGALFAVPLTSIGLTIFRFVHAKASELQGDLDAHSAPAWRRRPKPPPKVRVWREPRH
jgi:predicted PurR-regulated permease PerM